tara:strand:- start:180 stop:491 length:312 start_codon:yes stop_codon:yes gene_type:complete
MKSRNINFQKQAYIHLVETYCRYGYDISDMMHPTYKRISVRKCIDICNELFIKHNYSNGIIEREEDYKTFLSVDCTFYSSYGLDDRDQDSFFKEVRSNIKKSN